MLSVFFLNLSKKMETNLEKAKRLYQAQVNIHGYELPENSYVFQMMELAAKPNWIDIEIQEPISYEKGNWDGLRTDFVLVQTSSGNITKARAYIGFMDGSKFCDWYLENDFELHEKVTHFMKLPQNSDF